MGNWSHHTRSFSSAKEQLRFTSNLLCFSFHLEPHVSLVCLLTPQLFPLRINRTRRSQLSWQQAQRRRRTRRRRTRRRVKLRRAKKHRNFYCGACVTTTHSPLG